MTDSHPTSTSAYSANVVYYGTSLLICYKVFKYPVLIEVLRIDHQICFGNNLKRQEIFLDDSKNSKMKDVHVTDIYHFPMLSYFLKSKHINLMHVGDKERFKYDADGNPGIFQT